MFIIGKVQSDSGEKDIDTGGNAYEVGRLLWPRCEMMNAWRKAMAVGIIVVQSLSHVCLFVTPWTAARQAFLSLTISWSLPRFMSIESVMPFNLSSVVPFSSCPHPFPASGSFPVSWLFTSGDWSTGASASASVLPVNIQGWFPLELTDLISLHTKGLSRVFSSTTIWKQFFGAQPSLWSNSHIHTWLLEKQ